MRAGELLPWRRLTIETCWPPSVAASEIQKCIGPSHLFGGGDGVAPFVGRAGPGGSFQFSRRIAYRNSFLPVIRVVIEPAAHDGARVRVAMRLHVLVMGFMIAWMCGSTLIGVGVAMASLHDHRPNILVLAFPVFGAALTVSGFLFEARKAERLLREIFVSAPALPPPPETGEAYR